MQFIYKRFIGKKPVGTCCSENLRSRESSFWLLTFCGCFYSLIITIMKANDYHRSDYLEKLWLTISKIKKIRNLVDETYYNLCAFGLYWDAYNQLQKVHWIINDLLDDEYIDEDDFWDLQCFITNYCCDF